MLYLKRVVFIPRKARENESGIYHIILRGINYHSLSLVNVGIDVVNGDLKTAVMHCCL